MKKIFLSKVPRLAPCALAAIVHTALLAAVSVLMPAAVAQVKQLNLYNWDDYIGETTLDDFAEASGIEVRTDYFADGEEQFAKLRSGGSGYHISVPSNDFVERMAKAGLLMKLDHSQIPNLANLAKLHQNPSYDPGNQYSIPYMWGTMGIAYRKSAVAKPTSWHDVFDAAKVKKNRVAWISESSSMVPVVSMMLGGSANDLTDNSLKAAFEVLRAAKPFVIKIAEDNGQDLLAAGEVDYAIEWSGDIAQLVAEDDDIGFVIPKEGSIYFVDCMVILKDGGSSEQAHKFLNYILDAEVGRDIAEYIAYATPNAAAYAITSDDYRSNPVTFPPADAKLETISYPGEKSLERLYRYWELLLTD